MFSESAKVMNNSAGATSPKAFQITFMFRDYYLVLQVSALYPASRDSMGRVVIVRGAPPPPNTERRGMQGQHIPTRRGKRGVSPPHLTPEKRFLREPLIMLRPPGVCRMWGEA